MVFRHFYYHFKPYLPWGLRLALRRFWLRRKYPIYTHVWPINHIARHTPKDWKGWPKKKDFAFVLTHDVETQSGLDRCRNLMALEQQCGFRSSFNFVPEGGYTAPGNLREELSVNGFEIGVHDHRHDGKLYQSRERFRQSAQRINQYLHTWNAVGFRSAFMLHNLDWLHDLNIQYDASTFDTDPFEPQPDGVDTIFPFWVPSLNQESHTQSPQSGYVELPYTLPQDFSLFILMREQTINIWKRKVDWIVRHGGMVLLDAHPDYMAFNGHEVKPWMYSATLYQDFLNYVRNRYEGAYWHATPCEVASFVNSNKSRNNNSETTAPNVISSNKRRNHRKIWIDLDNTPHVPLFEPIIDELTKRDYSIVLTARDAFQVCELAKRKGLPCIKIGRHHGKNRIRKVTGLFFRALQLMPTALRERPVLGLSHGSRSQIILCNLLRIPTLLMADYEYAKYPPLMRPTWEMVPEVIPDETLYCPKNRIRKYPGIKEDVYVPRLKPDAQILDDLELRLDEIMVVARPPATEAHYHNPESEKLFTRFMDRICACPGARVVLLPRNTRQGELMQKQCPLWFNESRTVIPETAVDGLNLLWHADLVVSGGGTMNREAAALGVPVYSIFRGEIGAVDRHLQSEKKLILIENMEDIESKITLVKRPKREADLLPSAGTLEKIVEHVENIFAFHNHL